MAAKARGSQHDRRKSTREDLKIPVDYSAVDAFFSEFTTNVNEGGMFIATETPSPLGTEVALEFRRIRREGHGGILCYGHKAVPVRPGAA